MPRTQVFEIELEVPDDAPEFEKRLERRVAVVGDLILYGTPIALHKAFGIAGTDCFVAVPKKTWRPATREDVAAQILGTKNFEWRLSDDGSNWQHSKCVGYDSASTKSVFLCRYYAWEHAEVLA